MKIIELSTSLKKRWKNAISIIAKYTLQFLIYLSREPGVKVGLSPTLKLLDFLVFFSKYFLASAFNLPLYSFSIAARSR